MTRRPAATATTAVAARATEAADTLMAWLQIQPGAGGILSGAAPKVADPAAAGGTETASAQPASVHAVAPPMPVDPAGAVTPPPLPDLGRTDRDAPLRLPARACALPFLACSLAHTDWLHHRLQVIGPVMDLAGFRAAAAGAGTVPWQLDLDRMAEDIFHLLVAPPVRAGSLIPPARSLSLAGARIVADQLCAAAARRQALAVAQVGRSRACPLDLHALVPVPDAVLRRGPDDPIALNWLWTHWGTTQTLRHVADDATAAAVLRTRGAAGEAVWAVSFWSADWTPWRALAQIAARWPTLRFDARPSYDTA